MARQTPALCEKRPKPATPKAARACEWCGARLKRRTGGKHQWFCSTACRRSFDSGLRAWAQQEWDRGAVTIARLQRARCSEAPQALERPTGTPKDGKARPVAAMRDAVPAVKVPEPTRRRGRIRVRLYA